MTNEELLKKLQEDMELRRIFKIYEVFILSQMKKIIKYFNKPMEKVSTEEIRKFLLKHLKGKRKLGPRSINYYNSIIRFIYDVVLDKPINQKQIPMLKGKRRLPKILSEKEHNVFFNACENYEYKTIFMLIYGSRLRISEATNLRIKDVDSKAK